ncbi:hypothetical protein DUNSADRAFT_5943 [Dunaliella salina]|uniref:Uncharacterized protein n=1 Tax=Dunaliella salina TaxID=3046 RepID=A0ABQ7GPB2_DUNSA|nr:hypothetical protein DUNSADRAFT_5943 [Dunaliella salina]|eukprot:KAF5836437.1 hypothetical protein DUNSADRAFT_5943 [Dunaliella salina]
MDEVDWVALGSMRHVLKPKLQVLCEEYKKEDKEEEKGEEEEEEEEEEKGKKVHSVQQQLQQQQQERTQHGNGQQQQLQQKHERTQYRINGQQQPAPLATCQQQHLFNSLVANPHSFEVVARAHEALVVLPPRSRFIMGDLMDKRTLAPLLPPAGCPGTYKHIVIDPPWENASVKRSGRYQQLPARQLLKLPVARLLHPVLGPADQLDILTRELLAAVLPLPLWSQHNVQI